jgi:hypothetical protein
MAGDDILKVGVVPGDVTLELEGGRGEGRGKG